MTNQCSPYNVSLLATAHTQLHFLYNNLEVIKFWGSFKEKQSSHSFK